MKKLCRCLLYSGRGVRGNVFRPRGQGTLRLAPLGRGERPSFLRTIAEASFMADLKNYHLLRPVLLELKKEWPKPAWETLCADATDFRAEGKLGVKIVIGSTILSRRKG